MTPFPPTQVGCGLQLRAGLPKDNQHWFGGEGVFKHFLAPAVILYIQNRKKCSLILNKILFNYLGNCDMLCYTCAWIDKQTKACTTENKYSKWISETQLICEYTSQASFSSLIEMSCAFVSSL